MQRAYRMLLRLYPPDYRVEFADEMVAVFMQGASERRSAGWLSYANFLLREYAGVCVSAVKEQPGWLNFVPVVGGVSVAALLHVLIYAVIFKLFDVVGRAVGDINFATGEPVSPVIAVILCLATLLGLLPLFFLLSMRLLQRQR